MIAEETWQQLYQAVEALPEDEQQVVDLLWICGFTQLEAGRRAACRSVK